MHLSQISLHPTETMNYQLKGPQGETVVLPWSATFQIVLENVTADEFFAIEAATSQSDCPVSLRPLMRFKPLDGMVWLVSDSEWYALPYVQRGVLGIPAVAAELAHDVLDDLARRMA